MGFDNKTIKAPVKHKPHIVKVQGFWRVSKLSTSILSSQYRVATNRWNQAHLWAALNNDTQYLQLFEQLKTINLLN